MAQIDYKKILGKIFSRKIDVREKLKVDPSRSWLAIWIFFTLGLIAVFSGIAYLKFMVLNYTPSVEVATSTLFKFNQKKLDLIMTDYNQRVGENKKIQTAPPVVVDPGK